ncbi:Transcription factor E2FB-like protein [Drosera capensis]
MRSPGAVDRDSQPLTPPRRVPFSSTKPPFSQQPPDYHHLFDGGECRTPLERLSLSLRHPISGKGRGRGSRISNNGRAGSQTPMSSVGTKSGYLAFSNDKSIYSSRFLGSPGNVMSLGPCRYDSSLSLIKHADDGILDLTKAVETLEVQKRRIYDITNVLEGIGLIENKLKNMIQWKGLDVVRPGKDGDFANLQAGIENFSLEEHRLDEQIREMQERLGDLSRDESIQKWLFVTEEDIKDLPRFQNETLIAIKAHHGTTLEVPDPDEAADYHQRRYRIVLRSTMGPIDVYLVSKFEEKFEDISPVEMHRDLPRNPENNQGMTPSTVMETGEGIQKQEQETQKCEDENASNDFVSGIMKIVPEADNEADYWLMLENDVSITDMWRAAESGVDWNELNPVNADNNISNITRLQQESPPSHVTKV